VTAWTNIDRWLRLFLTIAQRRSVSGAAEALDLTQSGLSRQLASLEAYLGQRLFERHGRGMELTEAGQKLEAATRSAFDRIDAAITTLRRDQGVTEGSLKVATVHTLSSYFVAAILAKFMSQRPSVNVSMLGRSSPGVVDLVETGKADIGFVYDVAVASENLEIRPLFTENMSLVTHETSNLASESSIDLLALSVPLVVFPPDYVLRRMLHTARLKFEVAAEVETVDAMLNLVSLTRGHCILPDPMPVEILRDHGLLRVQIANPLLVQRVVAIARRDRPLTPLGELMLQIAQTIITRKRNS
jgi:DNA-binding transcriptional LysR family regulator